MSEQLKYQDVGGYLRTFSSEQSPYDFNGLLQLIAAGLENMRQNATDQDLVDYAWTLSEEQIVFLRRLIDARPQSVAEQEREK